MTNLHQKQALQISFKTLDFLLLHNMISFIYHFLIQGGEENTVIIMYTNIFKI